MWSYVMEILSEFKVKIYNLDFMTLKQVTILQPQANSLLGLYHIAL